VREEAAYLVDRLCGGVAGLPITTRSTLEILPGTSEQGALQAFAQGHIGCMEDFAMPRNYQEAVRFIALDQAEAIAILDMRVFNTDRHAGNLLLKQLPSNGGSHTLFPIDHGCCLPPWYSLGEAHFDAWRDWPHLVPSPSPHALSIVSCAVEALPRTVRALRDIGLDESSVLTLQLCTAFLEIGVLSYSVPLVQLAGLLLRDDEDDFKEPSWFEVKLASAAVEAGISCHFDFIEFENNGRFAQCLVEDNCGDFDAIGKTLDSAVLLDAFRLTLERGLKEFSTLEN
jgi:hypothetical protein